MEELMEAGSALPVPAILCDAAGHCIALPRLTLKKPVWRRKRRIYVTVYIRVFHNVHDVRPGGHHSWPGWAVFTGDDAAARGGAGRNPLRKRGGAR